MGRKYVENLRPVKAEYAAIKRFEKMAGFNSLSESEKVAATDTIVAAITAGRELYYQDEYPDWEKDVLNYTAFAVKLGHNYQDALAYAMSVCRRAVFDGEPYSLPREIKDMVRAYNASRA
jgi:hypothetical protein